MQLTGPCNSASNQSTLFKYSILFTVNSHSGFELWFDGLLDDGFFFLVVDYV